MLLHSATADPDGQLLDRLPDVLDAMKSQMQYPSAGVSQLVARSWPYSVWPRCRNDPNPQPHTVILKVYMSLRCANITRAHAAD